MSPIELINKIKCLGPNKTLKVLHINILSLDADQVNVTHIENGVYNLVSRKISIRNTNLHCIIRQILNWVKEGLFVTSLQTYRKKTKFRFQLSELAEYNNPRLRIVRDRLDLMYIYATSNQLLFDKHLHCLIKQELNYINDANCIFDIGNGENISVDEVFEQFKHRTLVYIMIK